MERKSTLDATRQGQNLDTNYSKADFQSIVKHNCKHLNAEQQKKLLQLLMKYESLFDGSLGDWKTKLVSSQLKKGETPFTITTTELSQCYKYTKKCPHKRNWETV